MNLFFELRKLLAGKLSHESLIVPLMKWNSGSIDNIEEMQYVNKLFFYTPKSVLNHLLLTKNNIKKVIPYPKKIKKIEGTEKFIKDICSYYGWTTSELEKNSDVIDLEELKTIIAEGFAYNNKERKAIKLKPIKRKGRNI